MQASNGETKGLGWSVEKRRPIWEKGVVGDWATRRPRGAWWLLWTEKLACVGAWIALCRKFFLRWVDRAEVIPKVGSPTGKVAGKSFWQPR